ncbi:MAG: hypothetical protein RR829_05605, partial [Oscillospiraceae bacterium]
MLFIIIHLSAHPAHLFWINLYFTIIKAVKSTVIRHQNKSAEHPTFGLIGKSVTCILQKKSSGSSRIIRLPRASAL